MERERGSVEILVHTSAPSRGKDDANYRALAKAYLLFEPVTRLTLCNDNANAQLSASKVYSDNQSSNLPLNSTQEELRRCPTTFVDQGSENLYDVSQSQGQASSRNHITLSRASSSLEYLQASFSSVQDNLNSPVLLRPGRTIKTPPPSSKRKTDHLTIENESSWETPPSVIPDSQSPYNRVIPEFSSPTRILELYLQHFDTSGSVPSSTDAGRGSQAHDASSINLLLYSSQPQASSSPQNTPPVAPTGTEESPQIIRETPYAEHHRKSKSPRSSRARLAPPQKTATLSSGAQSGLAGSHRYHVPTIVPAKQVAPSPPPPTPQTSPPRKRRKLEVPGTTTPKPPKPKKPPKHILPPRITPSEIHPPPPRTSSWGPVQSSSLTLTHIITPALSLLATQLELPRRYRPQTQTRPLCALERGYWAVSMAAWSSVLREQAWAALGAYLGRGRAGWGVWAVKGEGGAARDALAGEDGLEGEGGGGGGRGGGGGEGGQERQQQQQMGLRVFCWGAVAGHVYLLLYLVSQRKVKETGARWVDGGGEVVVRMP